MKNRVIIKALCIALASAFIFGGAASVSAAEENAGQSQTAVAASQDTAEVAASQKSAAAVYSFSVGTSSETENAYRMKIVSKGKGESVRLYVNDVLFETYGADGNGEWNINDSFYGKAGATYTFKLVATGTDGAKATKTITKKIAACGFDEKNCMAKWDISTGADGYSKCQNIYLIGALDGYINSIYQFDVYRSTSPNSGYVKLARRKESTNYRCFYDDYTAELGKTYYYQIKLVAGKDSYIKEDIVLDTTPVIKVEPNYDAEWMYFDADLGSRGVDITISNSSMYNQFDVYRSAYKNGGYSKIRTTASTAFTDTTVKAGKTYFYKIIPKYYDPKTQKLYSGSAMPAKSGKGVTVLMGTPELEIDKLSSTSAKLSWEKVRGANVYEIWYMQANVDGNRYSRLAVTKGTSYTVKGLAAGRSYNFLLKAQNVSGGKVVCENTDYKNNVCMYYRNYIKNLRTTSIQTAISDDRQTYVIYTNLAWDKTFGASGYVITAHNNYTGRKEVIAKFTSAARTTCRFRNPGSRKSGMKYSDVTITSYKGSELGSNSVSCSVDRIPFASDVKVTRKTNATAVVSWKAVPGAASYSVYRKNLQSGIEQLISSTSETSYVDSNFSVKTGYMYYIKPSVDFSAVSYSRLRDYENVKGYTYTYEHKLGAPKMAKAENTAANTVTVSWNEVSGAQAYYIYRATSKNGKYSFVGAVKELSYADKKAAKGQTYYYKTTAIAVGGNGVKAQSAYSAAVGIKCTK